MGDSRRLGALARHLAWAFLIVAATSLAVLSVGTVVPHLMADPPADDDAVSVEWLLAATVGAFLTAVVMSVVIARRVTRPVDDFLDTARRFAAGDHSARPTLQGPPELNDLVEALVAAADEVELSEQARRQLTADIAHELRTPLAVLQGGLEELRDGLVEPDHQTLASLHDQASRLGRIVNDLSELAAAESTGLQLRREDVNLARVADWALAARAGSLESAGIETGTELDEGVVVRADADRLHQVVGNLLANTVHYCRPGDRVTVRVRASDGHGVLEVADTGPGFRAEELPHVFDRAWRGASADGTRGSGLGLPIVRALVLAQGGSVAIDSGRDHGATVRVSLPLAADA